MSELKTKEPPFDSDYLRDRAVHSLYTIDFNRLIVDRMAESGYIKSETEYQIRVHSLKHAIHHYTLLEPHLNNSTVVDLGCGQLQYLHWFPNDKIARYIGIDMNKDEMERGAAYFVDKFNLELRQESFYKTTLPDESADVLISCEALEHLSKPAEYLAEACRVLKIGGVMSLSTPGPYVYFAPHNLGYIIKPFEPEELFGLVEKFI